MLNFALETFVLGLKNLRLHKLRSLLTALGIILGVAAVIVMVAIGEGGKLAALEQVEQLGATNILVKSMKPVESNDASQRTQRVLDYGIKRDDLQRIRTLPNLESIVPVRDTEQRVVRGDIRAHVDALGTTAKAIDVMNLDLERGEFFNEQHEKEFANVCVLGAFAAQQLFPYSDPIGEPITVGSSRGAGVVLKVIGVLAPTGLRPDASSAAGNMIGRNLDQAVYFPLSVSDRIFGDAIFRQQAGTFERKNIQLSEIWVRTYSIKDVEEMAGIVENVVKTAHGSIQDVQVQAPIQILRAAEQQARLFNFVIVAIAAISLVVGGIGIMNIMLATVTERTKEIGIRRALGAKQKHITLQFLIETTVISLTGGLIGAALGIGLAKALPIIVKFFSASTNYPTSITTWSVLGGLSISVMIGIGFGLYPAMTAARMNPIEALRHE